MEAEQNVDWQYQMFGSLRTLHPTEQDRWKTVDDRMDKSLLP